MKGHILCLFKFWDYWEFMTRLVIKFLFCFLAHTTIKHLFQSYVKLWFEVTSLVFLEFNNFLRLCFWNNFFLSRFSKKIAETIKFEFSIYLLLASGELSPLVRHVAIKFDQFKYKDIWGCICRLQTYGTVPLY